MPLDLSVKTRARSNPNAYSRAPFVSRQAAQNAARQWLQRGLSQNAEAALQLLIRAEVLPQYHFPVSSRALCSYHARRLLDRLPYVSEEARGALGGYGLPVPPEGRVLLYALGPVGCELARLRYGEAPPETYPTLESVLPTLARNEIILRLANPAAAAGWRFLWASPAEAALRRREETLFRPDALIKLEKGGVRQAYLLVYHDQYQGGLAGETIRLVERARTSELWKAWGVDVFPPVLVVYRNGGQGKDYQNEISTLPPLARFYGRSLEGFFKDPSLWYGFHAQKKDKLLSWL